MGIPRTEGIPKLSGEGGWEDASRDWRGNAGEGLRANGWERSRRRTKARKGVAEGREQVGGWEGES